MVKLYKDSVIRREEVSRITSVENTKKIRREKKPSGREANGVRTCSYRGRYYSGTLGSN